MASKIVVFVALVAACNAVPVYYNEVLPVWRVGRAPLSYGFGTGFASDIAGVKQATGFGTSFSSGDSYGQAYGSGIGSTNGGYARGVGIASTGNTYQAQPIYQAQPVYQAQPTYSVPQPTYTVAQPTYTVARPTYNNAAASAQNFGGSNLATSSANNGQAVSYTQNLRGLGYGSSSATSHSANDGFGNQKAVSTADVSGLGYKSHSVSAAERHGAYTGSTAHTVQQLGNSVQQSGATSINAPGFKAAHSHAVQTGFY